jgi:agmatine deiminase
MKILFPILVVFLFLSGCKSKVDPSAFYMPAEWELQEAIWMGWDGALEKEDTLHLVTARIISEIQETMPVVLWVTSDSLKEDALRFLKEQKIPMNRVEIAQIPGDKVMWARDIAPAFVINRKGERRAIDFNHTGIIRYRKRYTDISMDSARLARAIARDAMMLKGDSLMAIAKGVAQQKSWMNIEGGAYDVNGLGSLLVSEPFLFRNLSKEMADTLTKADFEREFKHQMGVTNVVWLGEGLAEDEGWGSFFDNKYTVGGTRGHVDEFARFVNPTTILLAWVNEAEKDLNSMKALSYARMQKNYEILKNARDQDGKPFTIIKVPLPDHFFKERILDKKVMDNAGLKAFYERNGFKQGDTLQVAGAGSYLNFLIANDKVIIPSYTAGGSAVEKENKVREIFESVFPDKQLVFVDARYVNLNGGGIHCITKQVPMKTKQR